MRGRLFVFEGPDGAGKTTLSKCLLDHLKKGGARASYMSFPGKESGTLGALVYDVHHDPGQFGIEQPDPTSLQLLHIAAHVDLIEKRIRPVLMAGDTLVLDRFWWSTWVYGKNLGARTPSLERMISLEKDHWADLQPNCAFLVFRTSAARPEQTAADYAALSKGYDLIAQQESGKYPVVRISTDSTLDESVAHVIQYIQRFR
jgi:dTMP kinase